MTNAQKWIALFLGLFIILLIITYATEPKEEGQFDEAAMQTALTGEQIYADLNCASCHGGDLQGTNQAPALLNLGKNWTKTELINYLRNPESFGSDERIKKFKEQFGNSFMPDFDGVETKRLGILAEYLLSK